MKNSFSVLKPLSALLLAFFSSFSLLLAQQQPISLGCGTSEVYQQQLRELRINGQRAPFWIDEGYGSSCLHTCTNTHNPSNCSGSATYKVPVKVWLFSDDNGTNQLVTAAVAAQHLAYVNSYFACQGIPVSFYQVTGSPQLVQSTDLNDFDNPMVSGDGDNAFVRANHYQNNVMNLYVPKALGGPGCNGYAYLPLNTTETNASAVMMDGVCFQNVANVCSDPSWAVVMIHEFGHFLGLYHTHNPRDLDASNMPVAAANECPDGSNACSTGDYIQDTDADPNYSDPGITRSGCNITAISVTSPCATPFSTTANTENNIMSYNNSVGCRLNYSACQKTKMVDCLFQTSSGGRSYLCDTDISRHFASTTVNAANSPYYEICAGGTIPTFTTLNASCYNWYTVSTGGTPFLTNAGSFTPTAAQVPVNVPGTYRFYAQEANAYNGSCRVEVYVKVNSVAGVASPASFSKQGAATLSLNTSASTLASSGELLGWWVKAAPVTASDFANQSALNTAIAAATIGGTVSGTSPNNIFAATTGTPKTALSLPIDCAALTVGQTYYATPIVSKGGVTTPSCTNTFNLSSGTAGSGSPAQFPNLPSGRISCRAGTPATITYNITMTVTGFTGAAGTLGVFRKTGSCSGSYSGNIFSGNGTYNFTQTHFPAGYDPNDGLCFMVTEHPSGNGAQNATVTTTITTNYTYNLSFPDVTLNNCTFGTPSTFVCTAPLNIELLDFQGKQVNNNVQLTWQTANEHNNELFTISRSSDGLNFETLTTIKGAMNSTDKRKYRTEDTHPFLGRNYYRLSQTDVDGKINVARTIVVNMENRLPMSIQPNPVTEQSFEVKFFASRAQTYNYFIYNNLGQLLQRNTMNADRGNNQSSIKIENLKSGIYHLVLSGQDTDTQSINFVVR